MSKDTIKSLRKQNDGLKAQIESLMKEFKKLEEEVNSKGTRDTSRGDHTCLTPDKETQKSLEYLGNEYDELNRFSNTARQQISRLETRLTELADKVENLSKSIDEVQHYSYSYNVKLVGIPEFKPKESAIETSTLCVEIFKAMGVQVSIQDIDIAHRVGMRKENNGRPKPIICKFARRLAREQVMVMRRDVRKIDPISIGLSQESSLSNAGIYDHLTPKLQQLLTDAKKVKDDNNFRFCWTKNSVIYLRKSEDSQPIRIKHHSDLENITTE